MNTQLAKNIKRYVKLKMKENQIPGYEEKRLYKTFKNVYESADATKQEQYKEDMEKAFQLDDAKRAPVLEKSE